MPLVNPMDEGSGPVRGICIESSAIAEVGRHKTRKGRERELGG
jgi:hypothetical protein